MPEALAETIRNQPGIVIVVAALVLLVGLLVALLLRNSRGQIARLEAENAEQAQKLDALVAELGDARVELREYEVTLASERPLSRSARPSACVSRAAGGQARGATTGQVGFSTFCSIASRMLLVDSLLASTIFSWRAWALLSMVTNVAR